MIGLYRMHCGGEIVRSFYDFDAQKIGPYKVPFDLYYNVQASTSNLAYEYIYYKTLLSDDAMLAVFNLNNHCICCLYPDRIQQVNLDGCITDDMLTIFFKEPMKVPALTPIGYWKTYQQNLTVTQAPFSMFIDENGDVVGAKELHIDDVLPNPPVNIYSLLTETPEDTIGIFYTLEHLRPMYVCRNPETQKCYISEKGGA